MDEVKSFLASKTIWGAVIAILPQLLALFGLQISAADAQGIAGHADTIVSAVGGLLAIYGRVTAKTALRV